MRKIRNEETPQFEPEELVVRAFSRCSNYPKERVGVLGLARGLANAAERFGVAPREIISECINTSPFCPTDHDLMEVAQSLKPARQERTKCPLKLCDGSGWLESFSLHTVHPGSETKGSWTEKRRIETREIYQELVAKVDWKTQFAYEGRYRCQCHPRKETT